MTTDWHSTFPQLQVHIISHTDISNSHRLNTYWKQWSYYNAVEKDNLKETFPRCRCWTITIDDSHLLLTGCTESHRVKLKKQIPWNKCKMPFKCNHSKLYATSFAYTVHCTWHKKKTLIGWRNVWNMAPDQEVDQRGHGERLCKKRLPRT